MQHIFKLLNQCFNITLFHHLAYFAWFQVDDEAMDLNKELMSKLLELDDVDAVYTDQSDLYLGQLMFSCCESVNL